MDASMKLLNNSVILKILPVTLFRGSEAGFWPWKRLQEPACGPEKSYRKPSTTCKFKYFSYIRRPMIEREAGTEITEIMTRLPEQFFKLVRVFMEESNIFTFIFLFIQTLQKF